MKWKPVNPVTDGTLPHIGFVLGTTSSLSILPEIEFERWMKPTIFSTNAAAPWRLATIGRPRGVDWLSDELIALSREGVDVLVSMLTTEEAQGLDCSKNHQVPEARHVKAQDVSPG